LIVWIKEIYYNINSSISHIYSFNISFFISSGEVIHLAKSHISFISLITSVKSQVGIAQAFIAIIAGSSFVFLYEFHHTNFVEISTGIHRFFVASSIRGIKE
jgi:hypothetical protein